MEVVFLILMIPVLLFAVIWVPIILYAVVMTAHAAMYGYLKPLPEDTKS